MSTNTDGTEIATAYSRHVIGQLLQSVPLLQPTMACGAVADLFTQQPKTPAFVVQLAGGTYGLVERNSYLTRYLDRYNRDIFQRRPIIALLDRDPLVVDHEDSIHQVGLLVTSERPDALRSAFVITKDGAYVGIGMGIDLMRALAKLAEEASVAKTTFLTNMSHEIRTPLNSVIGNLELLAATRLDGEQSELARTASVSAHALLDLIGDLLDLSKIEADRLDIEMVDCDIRAVVDEVITIALPRARQKNLRLVGWVASSVPALVRSDPLRLRQVLINFVGNAVKFADAGGVFIDVRAAGSGETAQLTFEVLDTGPGFDPDRAAALFEPFVQEDASTTRRFGGTGLGLAIAKRIVEILGGTIGCSTEPGLGARFWCTVPAAIIAPAPVQQAASLRAVAVVGDNATADDVRTAMQVMGIAIASKDDTRAEHGPVVVFGAEQVATEAGKGRFPVLLTSDSSIGQRYRAHRAGADFVLNLPDDIGEIPAVLMAIAVARRRKRDADAAMGRQDLPAMAIDGVASVLVIDDTSTNRELAARQLMRAGLRCDTAENGLVGFEMTAARRYALILVDGSMPVMDGFEFARKFRERETQRGDGRTPIIAVTAHALAGDAQRFLAVGMDDYLAKPVTLDKLRGKLVRWLPEANGISLAAPPAATKDDAAVDLTGLAAMLGDNDPIVLAEMLTIFVGDFPTLMQPIHDALQANDRTALARAAHAGKSAAGSAAAKPLTSLLARLEEMAPTGEAQILASLDAAIALEFSRFEAQARFFIAEANGTAPPPLQRQA
ncbi:MAG TPA: ATP-binding protein [Magnetospirillaceae bacterium]|jgi:signal transduction histidine kinase/CheY-like chemotaxis protein